MGERGAGESGQGVHKKLSAFRRLFPGPQGGYVGTISHFGGLVAALHLEKVFVLQRPMLLCAVQSPMSADSPFSTGSTHRGQVCIQ